MPGESTNDGNARPAAAEPINVGGRISSATKIARVSWTGMSSTWPQRLERTRTRLWSVEVKLDLDIHNVRDAYYQTMMNSGWANVAYLAAWQINSDAEQEARELWERQGVGLIHIRAGRPEKSRILIHAREREGLDWRAVDRLTRENEDFRRFVRDVR